MKKLLLICLSLCFPLIASQNEPIKDCKCKKKNLYGKVKIVEAGEDLKIRVVESGEDLRVHLVDFRSDHCGEWQIVEVGEDFRVRFVEAGEDFRIRYVDYRPY
jgi:hypothetical protein